MLEDGWERFKVIVVVDERFVGAGLAPVLVRDGGVGNESAGGETDGADADVGDGGGHVDWYRRGVTRRSCVWRGFGHTTTPEPLDGSCLNLLTGRLEWAWLRA